MHNIGIKLDLQTGGFISHAAAAKQAVRDLDREIEEADKKGDKKRVGELHFTKQKMAAAAEGFQRDVNSYTNDPRYGRIMKKQDTGQALSKSEEKYIARLEELNGSMKKMVEAIHESIKTGDAGDIRKQIYGFEEQVKDFHTVAGGGAESAAVTARDAVKAIGIDKLTSAINQGFSAWAGSLNRSGIINQYGSGDILGGRIAEQRRQANMAGGFAQAGLGVAGTAAGFFLPGGPLVWGTIGSQIGSAIQTALGIAPDLAENDAAFAGLWQQRSADAMQLAALSGDPKFIREAFKIAADAAAEFGYSAEEGMEAMKQAAQQGLDGQAARDMAREVFRYERGTGADRGTLTSISAMSERYGGGDALRSGWAGLHASGMQTGQYSEYLRSMQRVMEDGISKGFKRSSEDVAKNLTMLSHMTGNNPLWQGENGARRLSEMNSGLEGTTGLQSAAEIRVFRAARQIAEKYNLSTDYVDIMEIVEAGLSGKYGTELFNNTMRLNMLNGDRAEAVEFGRQQFGLNYTNMNAVFRGWQANGDINDSMLQGMINRNNRPLPDASSPELEWAKTTQEIVNLTTLKGQGYWDNELPKLYQELEKIRQEIAGTRPGAPLSEMAANETRRVFGDGYASQVQGFLENEEANRLQSEIMRARGSVAVNSMFFGGRATRGTPAVSGLFNRGEGEDLAAAARFQEYRDSSDPQAQRAFLEAVKILERLSNEDRQKLNNTNSINTIPSVTTDPQGHRLLGEIRDALAELRIDIDI